MGNVARFPYMHSELVNAHGYSTSGDIVQVKVTFVRYLGEDATTHFDCVVEDAGGGKSYCNTKELWRDGEEVPPVVINDYGLPYDKPTDANFLTMEEVDALKDGDELFHPWSGRAITVISTKGAPNSWRLRDELDDVYYDAVRDSMTRYSWRVDL